MAEYDRTNTFTLSRNERKEKETHADFRGTLNVNGVEYWLDAWTRESRDGRKFFSGRIRQKEKQPESGKAPAGGYASALNDDVPF